MIQRTALFAASLAASLVLVVGLVAAGFVPGSTPGPSAIQAVAADPGTPPQPEVQVDTVYLAPPAQPAEVTVTRSVTASAGGEDGEHEGTDD